MEVRTLLATLPMTPITTSLKMANDVPPVPAPTEIENEKETENNEVQIEAPKESEIEISNEDDEVDIEIVNENGLSTSEENLESLPPGPVNYKPKSHTTALDRAIKR